MLFNRKGEPVRCASCVGGFEEHIEMLGTSYAALSAGCTGWYDSRISDPEELTDPGEAADDWGVGEDEDVGGPAEA